MKNYKAAIFILSGFLFCKCQPDKKTETEEVNHEHVSATNSPMKLDIPASLKTEHQQLHQELEKLIKLPGKTGAAAKQVAEKLHGHFEKEEAYAMPPLGLLNKLAKGEVSDEMKDAIGLTDKLKAEMPQMLSEHQQIVGALNELSNAAKAENQLAAVAFVEKLKLHAQNEQELLYPAAILVGEYLKLKLNQSYAK